MKKVLHSFDELSSVQNLFLDTEAKVENNCIAPSLDIKKKIQKESNPKGLTPVFPASTIFNSKEKDIKKPVNQSAVVGKNKCQSNNIETKPEPRKENCLDYMSKIGDRRKNLIKTIVDNYQIGRTYSFYVEEMTFQNNNKYVRLYDAFCNSFLVKAKTSYKVGEKLLCKVIEINHDAKTENIIKLVLSEEERQTDVLIEGNTNKLKKDERVVVYTKSPEQWSCIVEGYHYHLYRNSFKCSCCQRNFLSGQGYKIEKFNEEIIFCKECKKLIFPKKGSGWMNIISIPMGNKR